MAFYAQLVHKARPSWRNISPVFLGCEFVDHARTILASALRRLTSPGCVSPPAFT